MPVNDFIKFINIARQKEKEERQFMQWVIQLPYMGEDNYISFKEYQDNLSGKNLDLRNKNEILTEIEEIEENLKVRGCEFGT